MIEEAQLISLACGFLCIGVLVRSAELILLRDHLHVGGWLGWGEPNSRRLVGEGGAFVWAFGRRFTLVVLVARFVACGALMVLPYQGAGTSWILSGLLVSQAYYNLRFRCIAEGSDTVFLTGLAACWVGSLSSDGGWLISLSLSFYGAQIVFAYVLSGWDKLKSPAWRSGWQLVRVFRFSWARKRVLGVLFSSHPKISRWCARTIIAAEILGPFAVFAPTPIFGGVLIAGALFHLSLVFLMGLRGFFWAFLSGYTGLYYIHSIVKEYLWSH